MDPATCSSQFYSSEEQKKQYSISNLNDDLLEWNTLLGRYINDSETLLLPSFIDMLEWSNLEGQEKKEEEKKWRIVRRNSYSLWFSYDS